jgi:hypothetical protein
MKPLALMMTNDTGTRPVHLILDLVHNLLFVSFIKQINSINFQQTTACLYQELITPLPANARTLINLKNPKAVILFKNTIVRDYIVSLMSLKNPSREVLCQLKEQCKSVTRSQGS